MTGPVDPVVDPLVRDGPAPVDETASRPGPDRAARRARTRRRRRVAAGCAVVVLLVVAALGWFLVEAYPIGGTGHPVVVEVANGETIAEVASALAAKGVIASSLAFRLDLMVAGAPDVQPGYYVLATSESFASVRAALGRGPNATAIDLVTGETDREAATAALDAEGPRFASTFLSILDHGTTVHSPFQPTPTTPLEGLVAPGTYVLVPGETPRTLVGQMVARFVRRAMAVGLSPTTSVKGLDAYRLVVVASIVEKEGYFARNMPKVATVIYNRLAQGMPLQMDSTVEYALGQDGGPVTAATEATASPYNTYLHTGLTPTPICIPSTQALAAALDPPPGPWLFFELVTRSGTLAFASTFAGQLANERLAQQRGLP